AVKKRMAKVKPTWDQVMAKTKKQPRLYVVAERYHENEVLAHPKFGTGFVSEVIGLDKIEVTFQTEKRVLIHNRQGMSLPPAVYAHVVDNTVGDVGKKGGKGARGQANGKGPPVKLEAAGPAKAPGKAADKVKLPAAKAPP